MTLADVLGRVAAALDVAGVPYMVSGSVAGTVHGIARMTHDVDLVIDPTPRTLDLFVDQLDPVAYYADRDAARDALARRSMFNVIDLATGWKIDCIVAATAHLLGQALGTAPEFWMNLQAQYDLTVSRPPRIVKPLRKAA